MSYGSSVLFDTTILFLTIAKLPNIWTTKARLGRQIFRDTLVYFTLTTVTNVVVLSIQALGQADSLLKPTAVPFSTVMTATMGSRVYLNLQLLEKRRRHQPEEESIPFGLVRGGFNPAKNSPSGMSGYTLDVTQAEQTKGASDYSDDTAQSSYQYGK